MKSAQFAGWMLWMACAALVLASCGNDAAPAVNGTQGKSGLISQQNGTGSADQANGETQEVGQQDANGEAPRPAPADPEPAKPQGEVDYVAFEGGLRVYPAERRIELDAYLLSDQTRPLEFMLVAPGGATHESLFATPARAEHLKRALEIIGLQEAEIKRSGRGYFDKPLGDRIQIMIRFNHRETGAETVVPVEDWLWDHRINAHPERVGWVFTGSHESYDPEINRSVFDADLRGNHIALWRDSSCVIDNDRPSGAAPDVYSPYVDADGLPKPGPARSYPKVVLIFEPFTAPDTTDDDPDNDD
jgi:hypothetical protein